MRITFIAAGVTAFALALASPAADTCVTPNYVVVQFGDLDLGTGQGLALLLERIKKAASCVCTPYWDASLAAKQQYALCMELAISTAVARVVRPTLPQNVTARSSRSPLAGEYPRPPTEICPPGQHTGEKP